MRLGGLVNAADVALHAPMGVAGSELAAVGDDVARAAAGGADGGMSAAAIASDAHAGAGALGGRVAALMERSPGELTVDDWDQLAEALAADPLGRELRGPRSMFEAPELHLVVDAARLGDREKTIEHADRYFEAWRAHARGPEAIRTGTHELMTRNPYDLTPEQWRSLRGMVDADPTGELTYVPPMARREYAGLRQTIVDLGGHGPRQPGETVDIQFRRWVRANDPAYPAKFEDAANAAASKRWTADQFWTLRVESDRLDDFATILGDRSPEDKRQIVWVASDKNTPYTAKWMSAHDPEYDQLTADAAEAALAGRELNPLERALLTTKAEHLDEFLAGRPFEERRTIASQALYGKGLADWNRANDPNWTTHIDELLDRYIAGDGDYKVWGPLGDEGEHLDALLAKRPYEQQRTYWSKKLNDERYVEWVRANDPDLDGTVRAALDVALSRKKTPDRTRLLLEAEAARLDEFIAGKPYEEQDRIARAMLHRNDYYEWNLGHNPKNRVKVDAAVQRIIDGTPREEGDGLLFVQEKDRIDLLTAGHPYPMQERIAREVLGQQSLYFTEWLARNDPNYDATLNAVADAAIAGTTERGDTGVLYWLREDLPKRVFAGRSAVDNLKLINVVNGSGTASSWVPGWRAALEPELSNLQRQAAAEAALGELSDDARLVLRGERGKLDELTAGADYETGLRIADAVLDSRSLQEWKVAHDTDRVARVRRSANAIADGAFTQHDMRVLRGEVDVIGTVRHRPYGEQLQVAEVALDRGSIEFWKRANDPDYQARIASAIDEVATGRPSPEALELIASDRSNVFRNLATRGPDVQGAVAAAMLGRETASFEGIQAAMRDLAVDARARLSALPDVEMTRDLRQSTTELLDLNIQRMTGFNGTDPNRGYARHPDYAEMGRVQANLELLEAVAKGQTSAASAKEVLSW